MGDVVANGWMDGWMGELGDVGRSRRWLGGTPFDAVALVRKIDFRAFDR